MFHHPPSSIVSLPNPHQFCIQHTTQLSNQITNLLSITKSQTEVHKREILRYECDIGKLKRKLESINSSKPIIPVLPLIETKKSDPSNAKEIELMKKEIELQKKQIELQRREFELINVMNKYKRQKVNIIESNNVTNDDAAQVLYDLSNKKD